MKKVLVAAILGLAVVANVKGQGQIRLYNYTFGTVLANEIKYGTGSGGTVGTSVTAATPFTVGVYYAVGNVASTVNLAMAGDTSANGSSAGWGLALATGTGATSFGPIGGSFVNNQAGQFGTPDNLSLGTAGQFPGTGDQPVTLVVVAYNGANYEASTIRGHSAAFTLTAANVAGNSFVLDTGSAMPGFSVSAVAPIPEPSTFALAGLGLAGLLIFRRRK